MDDYQYLISSNKNRMMMMMMIMIMLAPQLQIQPNHPEDNEHVVTKIPPPPLTVTQHKNLLAGTPSSAIS